MKLNPIKDIRITKTANVEVDLEIYEIIAGDGWAEGAEYCCIALHHIVGLAEENGEHSPFFADLIKALEGTDVVDVTFERKN